MKRDLKNDCRRLFEIAESYSETIQSNYQNIKKFVVREEYSVKSDLHRGYYCPSLVQDIVVGNYHRGKILKKTTKRSNPSHKYGFDKDDRLIIVNEWPMEDPIGQREVILYKKDTSIGITFSSDFEIEGISECRYDNGNITFYTFTNYYAFDKSLGTYRREEYTYSSKGLGTVDFYSYPIYTHDKYIFEHNSEGYLSTYITETYDDNENLITDTWADGHTYDVYVKRKV